jgi:hypothetical protein
MAKWAQEDVETSYNLLNNNNNNNNNKSLSDLPAVRTQLCCSRRVTSVDQFPSSEATRCEVWGSNSGVADDPGIMWCDAVSGSLRFGGT